VGAAGLCIDAERRVLLVLQGAPADERAWGLPGGGRWPDESLESCCIREVWEETGYRVAVRRELGVKTGSVGGRPFRLHFFEVGVEGGEAAVHDPDGFIQQVAWCSAAEVGRLPFTFPEDREWVLRRLQARGNGGAPAAHPGAGGKLVRDRIPEIMARHGQTALFEVATPADMPRLLLGKVREEAAEVAASGGSVEEIADLLEALDALARALGVDGEAIRRQRREKFGRNGGFGRGLVLLA